MFGSRLSLAAASSKRCIIDSNGLSSLISLASSTKALGIDFLRPRMLNAKGEHTKIRTKFQNGLPDVHSPVEPRLYPTFKGQATSEYLDLVLSRRDKQSREVIDAAINQIASDNTSGAAEILRRAGTVFTLLNTRSSGQVTDNSELAHQAVVQTCIALALAQPDMSALLRL